MLEIAYDDWLNLGFRWLHVIAGISWIGTSFYFIFLDLSLRKHGNLPEGVGGESWNVHGGGFYRMRKYTVAPTERTRRKGTSTAIKHLDSKLDGITYKM